jgi:hypothetical protein
VNGVYALLPDFLIFSFLIPDHNVHGLRYGYVVATAPSSAAAKSSIRGNSIGWP